MAETEGSREGLDFIRRIVEDDLAQGRIERVVTRFPPEPNGYLHIGSAKAVMINHGIAADYGGIFRLRFDDTNPAKEEFEFVEAIIEDARWLTGDESFEIRYASDYFGQMYAWAEQLVERGLAYVDDQSGDEIRANRGTVKSPGIDSPFRDRPVDENLDLLRRMKAGAFAEGACVLRAKIDMAAPDMLMRDPLMYRIQHAHHYRTGNAWHIYPLYDWAHGLEDAIEGVTHSLCSLEFETHRPLYDWFLRALELPQPPRQYEFAKLRLDHTVMGKRHLIQMVREGIVSGWDDPRLPTLRGLRRRGVPPEAIRAFLAEVGITKAATTHDWGLLEHHVRQRLNQDCERAMAVLDPVKVVVTNWPAERTYLARVPINPEDPGLGEREVPFGRELWIDRTDFLLEAPKKFFRLSPGREVRLRGVGFLRCDEAITDDHGAVVELRCTLDETTLGGQAPADGRKVKATIHWLSASHCVDAEVRIYEHLFTKADPTDVAEGEDWTVNLDRDSRQVVVGCKVPTWLAAAPHHARFQFERLGYFSVDPDATAEQPVFNRVATLRDAWARQKGR